MKLSRPKQFLDLITYSAPRLKTSVVLIIEQSNLNRSFEIPLER